MPGRAGSRFPGRQEQSGAQASWGCRGSQGPCVGVSPGVCAVCVGGPRGVPLRALSEQAEWRGAQRESGCPAAAGCWSRRPSCMHSCPRGCPWPASPVGPGVGAGAEERAQEVVAKARVPSGALGLPAALLLPRSGAGENTCCRMLEKLCPADRSRTGNQVCLGAPSVLARMCQCVLAATALW